MAKTDLTRNREIFHEIQSSSTSSPAITAHSLSGSDVARVAHVREKTQAKSGSLTRAFIFDFVGENVCESVDEETDGLLSNRL